MGLSALELYVMNHQERVMPEHVWPRAGRMHNFFLSVFR